MTISESLKKIAATLAGLADEAAEFDDALNPQAYINEARDLLKRAEQIMRSIES